MQLRLYRSQGAEQNWRDAWSLQYTSLTVRLPYGSDYLVYLHLFVFFSPYYKRHDDTPSRKKPNTTTSDCSSNLRSNNT